jgi:hypothetical protein
LLDRSGLRVRRSLFIHLGLLFFVVAAFTVLPAVSLWAQEETPEKPTTGTIQGTVRDDVGSPVEGARVLYSSAATDTKGVTRSGKDGAYVSEPVPPGAYVVRVEGRDMLPVEASVTVALGAAATADFKLEWINPGPVRLESKFDGEIVDRLPINGRNYLNAGQLEPGVQAVDGRIFDPGKSGFQSLSINGPLGRTTHYDVDEVESMDETRGASTLNLPADAVREVIVSRANPELFQSLNAAGAVRVTTRSGEEEWHGDIFGNLRDRAAGLAGFPSGSPKYSRQQYGFGAGGALIKDKAFLFLGGERAKQDGVLPIASQDLIFPTASEASSGVFNTTALRSAYFRENMLTARLDYNLSENMKWFVRLSYDNANEIGPPDSQSNFRNQLNVPAAVFGMDWNRGRFVQSARFGYQKMVDAINPALSDSTLVPGASLLHLQIGSAAFGPSVAGPRQTIQRDLFGRYDSSTVYKANHTIRFGGAVHRIAQGDFYAPANYASVASSNGIDVINAINGNPSLVPLIPGDPRGAADNPLNYPVGTVTIFNGLGNFSENSAFNRSTGGHFDTRIEGYLGDTFSLFPNLNISFGVNYVRDTGRTNSDLAAVPCSALADSGVANLPPCPSGLILDQFGLIPNAVPPGPTHQSLGQKVSQPDWNFAPQFGVAWDPGHNGRMVVRASAGMFYDNFLLQNAYQDRINRLSNGQYNRSLTLCPATSVLFPDGSVVGSVTADQVNISQICGAPIGGTVLNATNQPVVVAQAIQDLQSQFMLAQSAVTGGQNVYSLANSVANFGGLLAPGFKTPRVVHMDFGVQKQIGEHGVFSVDYVREIGTQFPLGIDTNHVGGSNYLTDGDNLNPLLNTYQAELDAITATVAPAGCGPATSTGTSSQTAVNCYLAAVPGATITDFARHGLDSSNAFCGPFPCSVLGKQQAAFGGINPAVGSNIMYFPGGRSTYQGLHLAYKTSVENPAKRVQRLDIAMAYAWSRYRTNLAEPNGSGGDYSLLNVAEDFNRPHRGHFGSSGLDRTHQFTFTPTAELPRGLRLSMIAHLASPLPLSLYLPQQDGGGVAGEIFRSDVSGDGTVGDILGYIGSTGKYSTSKLTQLLTYYNSNFAGKLTPAGQALTNAGLFTGSQLVALGAYSPVIQGLPGHFAEATWLKTIDLRLSWPLRVGERVKVEPNASLFNVFNFANFGGAGNQLSGVLNGAPGSSLNNASSAGFCGNSTTFCTSRLDRVLTGSGTYANGAPRQMEFGVRITF